MYYNRPSSELIFLTVKEHNAFNKGRKHSEESKNKMREAKKGQTPWNKGKHLSDETKNKLREAKKGKHHSDETRKKMREAKKGIRWYNNGKINIMAKECPDGFVPGILR